MFSKSKLNQPGGDADTSTTPASAAPKTVPPSKPAGLEKASPPKPKVAASVLSSDLVIKGDIKTTGDIQIEGEIEGNITAHLLTVGDGAVVRGEVIADDIVVNGRVIGRVRGLKVRLTSTARVEGDIIHKTIAIESGAHFEGAVQRQDDPLASRSSTSNPVPKPKPSDS